MWSELQIGGRCEAARLPANFVGGVFHTIITSFNPQKVFLLNEVLLVGRFLSFWEGLSLGAMLILGRVVVKGCVY